MMRALALAMLIGLGTLGSAAAQTYPTRPVRIVAPFPAGGLADVLARAVAEPLTKSLGQPFVIENRTGAGGNVGAEIVANAPPDGYTLMMSSAGILSINQFLYATMPFDANTAFAPITLVADMPMLLVVPPKTGVTTVQGLLELARTKPGGLNFGSAGNGTTGHLGLELFTSMTGLKITHIPYRGAAPSVTDLLAGQIDGLFDNPPTVLPHIHSGTIKVLGVASKTRVDFLPDVPTIDASGVPGYEASSWFGLVAPARTPDDIIAKLNAIAAEGLRQPQTQARFKDLGARLVGDTPAEFDRYIRAERVKWEKIVKSAGIRLE
jgi:tripartite-type tricarboxylate transporter receptor subunit TctC